MDEEKLPLDDDEKEEIEEKTEEPKEEPQEVKEEPKPEIKEEPNPKKRSCGIWKRLTIILLILLIIAVLTSGFKMSSIKDKISSITGGTVKETEGLPVTVLSDARCEECNTIGLMEQLRTLFPDMEVTELDYNDKQGKKLYNKLDIQYLPAILFDKSVEDKEQYEKLATYLTPVGDYMSLRMGADFDPTAEICDNEIDDNEDDKIDCEDEKCDTNLICNPDALVECAEENNVAGDILFYYSNGCGWCAKMKPGVTELEEEGYKFYWAETGDAEAAEAVNNCFSDYLGSGVPQFICMKNGIVHGGAFVDADLNMDKAALKKFADDCLAG